MPRIDTNLCAGCGWCVARRLTQAVALVGGLAVITRPADCVFCDVCETCCPGGAIQRAFWVEFSKPVSWLLEEDLHHAK